MKSMNYLMLALVFTATALAQQQPEIIRHPAKITFYVVTDEKKPVSNAEVSASTFLRWQQGEGFGKDIYEQFKGKTDGKGLVALSFNSERGDCRYGVYNLPGYYSTRNLQYQFKKVEDGKWQSWNPTIEVVAKPILNPIAMYARKIGDISRPFELPTVGKPIGFDLMKADWVAPYGNGSVSDLVFTLTEKIPYVDVEKPFDLTLSITFSNKGDGIQSILAPLNEGSDLRLPRFAPEDAYEPQLTKQIGRPAEGKPLSSGIREDQNYFIRVRTVLDEKGRIRSACYAKINGDIQFWGNRRMRFSYCLNPTPNDRNMEFDPAKNLFGELPFSERVTNP